MKVTSNKPYNNKPLTWDEVIVTENGAESRVVRRITIDIQAGDVATMDVETYGIDESDKINTAVLTNAEGPITTVRRYYIDKLSVDARSIEDIKKNVAETGIHDIAETLRSQRTTDINPINELEV